MAMKVLRQSCIVTVCEVYTDVTDQILIKSLYRSKLGILFSILYLIRISTFLLTLSIFMEFMTVFCFCLLLLNFLVFFFIQIVRLLECLVGALCSFVEVRA